MQISIDREDNARGGRYIARIEGEAEAGELTWRRGENGVVIANHTGVPASLQGKGIAAALVQRLVDDARAEGFRIVPAEWADLFVGG